MKKCVVLISLITCIYQAQAANEVDVSYQHNNFKQISDADTVKLSAKLPQQNFFEAIYGDIQFKHWDIEHSQLDKDGVSGHLVGYYNFGNNKQWFGVTQLQLGSSNLFPKSTLYQEVSYRAGEKKNLLLGMGVGMQDYYADDADTFYKIGPVYYFDGGSVGYKFGKYSDSGSTLNSIFGNYQINDQWGVNATYNFGEGYWNYQNNVALNSAEVKSSDLAIKLTRQLNNDVAVYGTLGKTTIKDKTTNQDSLSSDNLGLGLTYYW